MLAQGDSVRAAKPVAVASRTTNAAEKKYPQLDLEATGLDSGLRQFRHYLVGAPYTVSVVTDHKPLCSIFNGNRQGSIRTDRIKMRHQDIRFKVQYQKGIKNQTDFLSRNAKPLSQLSNEEQNDADDINNTLNMPHITPIIDHIGVSTIAEHVTSGLILKDLREIIEEGKTLIPKDSSPKLYKFKGILPEITVTGNGILLKRERISLSEALQDEAIPLAHRGSHPGKSGIERRLDQFVKGSKDCQIFTDKKITKPIQPHSVQSRCWEKVAVDLFGPMPSSNHAVEVQDLASCFPAAKVASSSKASKVIPALEQIYDAYDNPEKQLSDNGPPFNSKEMDTFSKERNITPEQTPPMHPSANPEETFMRLVGKTVKIAAYNRVPEKKALSQVLSNYCDTPHPSACIAQKP